MAGNNEIKTRLTLDGEKEFKQQIQSINRELREGNAQLKEVAATYDLNGNAQEKLTNKSQILRTQLDAQNRIVQEYENRMRQAEAATDLSADGLRNYSIQLTNARTKAKQLEKELNDTDRELEELGRDSRKAGDKLEDNLGEAAEDVENKFEKMAQGIKDSLEDVKDLQSISLGVDLVRGAWDIGENIANYVEQAVNDNLKRAMVEYNITSAGGDLGTSMAVANEYAGIFQDTDSAYEAVSNLVAAGYSDNELKKMAQYIGGAAIMFQDTLKIESLADSLQESLTSGELTGQISELFIDRLGYDEETTKEQFAEAYKNGQADIALEAYLANSGLAEYYEVFKEQNKELVEAATNLQEFNVALNELAGTTLPMLTPAIETLTTAIKWAADAIEDAIAFLQHPEEVVEEVLPDPTPGEVGVVNEKSKLEQWGAIIAQGATGGTQWFDMTNEMYGVGVSDLMTNGQTNQGQTRAEKNRADYLSYLGIGNDGEINNSLNDFVEIAGAKGEEAGAGLVSGLQSQSASLEAVAEAQRLALEEVWADPITPTVVVGYQTAGPVNQSLPEVNVTVQPADVNLDGRTVGTVFSKWVNSAWNKLINEQAKE